MKRIRLLGFAALLTVMLCVLCGCSAEDFRLPQQIALQTGQQCSLPGELRYTGDLSEVTAQERQAFLAAAGSAVVHFASTDPDVAAVDQGGVVTALTPGTATVLVSCVDLDFYAEVQITVHTPGATPESATPETATPETATPETATPETATPESATPETATPETATPETATPETATPETATPESATPETATPETATPESATPESATPESATPESATAETAAPGPSAPAASPEPGGTEQPPTHEPLREWLRSAGQTVRNFFAGLFDGADPTA